ncbi:hypothetical protein TEA_001089 [Camellia sinensis var. sinensis]|uniref:Fibronectin type III-like domain-containing protein n=1 Tax=Camellia sinensis var. sinensis TaxID=542762 RepID=A0A4S4E7Y0_CAMSN|nr:hypothetical protein TEA_001089 [Camellia sinensis var. sinensis]
MYWLNGTKKASAVARLTAASALAEVRTEKASTATRFIAVSALDEVQAEKANATANTTATSALAEAQKGVAAPNTPIATILVEAQKGTPCKYTTPLQGLTASVATANVPGCAEADVACSATQLDDAKKIAASSDATILVMGADQSIETEGHDRVDLTLPGQQQLLVTEIASTSKGPVILVIMSGGGMDVQFAKDIDKITSILWVGYPGEAGGAAIADVIFGYYNPSGRLPMSWYPQSYTKNIPMTNMNMRPDPFTGYPGRTYRFYTGPTIYTFGHGLSYTAFNHHLIQATKLVSIPLANNHACHSSNCKSIDVVDEQSCRNLNFNIHLRVRNTGKMSGGQTVFLFLSPPKVHNSPQKHLMGFEKVFLSPQTEGLVRFNVDVCKDLSVVDEHGSRKIALGQHNEKG